MYFQCFFVVANSDCDCFLPVFLLLGFLVFQEPEQRPTFAAVYKSILEFVGEDYDETVE